MTRQEEIRKAVDIQFPKGLDGRTQEQALVISGFELGAKWADEHPRFWRNINIMPRFWTHIVLCSSNGIFIVHTVCTTNYEKWITMCNVGNFTHWMPIPKLPND